MLIAIRIAKKNRNAIEKFLSDKRDWFKHWDGETASDENGENVVTHELLTFDIQRLEDELNRLFVVTRENLSIKDRDFVPPEIDQKIDRTLTQRGLVITQPKDHSQAREEVERVITRMLLKDQFFGQFRRTLLAPVRATSRNCTNVQKL